MPSLEVVFYREDDDRVPARDWLDTLTEDEYRRMGARVEQLEKLGRDILTNRRWAAYLGSGIYELRAKSYRINLRLLFCFWGRERVVLLHGLKKQTDKVPKRDIDAALARRQRYESDSTGHTYQEEE